MPADGVCFVPDVLVLPGGTAENPIVFIQSGFVNVFGGVEDAEDYWEYGFYARDVRAGGNLYFNDEAVDESAAMLAISENISRIAAAIVSMGWRVLPGYLIQDTPPPSVSPLAPPV